MEGTTHKTIAVALQNRRLVTVSKKKGVWRAEPTPAGKHFAENGEYPAGHWTTPPAASHTSNRTMPTGQDSSRPVAPESLSADAVAGSKQASAPKVTGLRPVEQMVADIVAAGGSLEVSDGSNYYDGLVASAVRFGKVPDGKLLHVVQRRGWGEKTLELIDKPAWMTETLNPVPVAERLVRPHPAVVALRADKTRLPFKQEIRQRALRILDAVAKEATRRGYTVTSPRPEHDPYQRRQNPTGDLVVTISGHPHALHVTQEPDKVPHEPTATEVRNFEKHGYPRIPKYDKVPSGRLTIAINGGIPVRQSAFGDTKTIDLTTRLPTLLQELELRAASSEERRLQAERDAAERRRHWEEVRAEAIIAVRETHRAHVLDAQVDDWHRAHQLTAYVAAMRDQVATLDGDDRTAADEWLDWATAHAARFNPLNRALRMPPDPNITPEALKPHMQGLSTYGPENKSGW